MIYLQEGLLSLINYIGSLENKINDKNTAVVLQEQIESIYYDIYYILNN